MNYTRVVDILPDVVSATERGLLKWESRAGGKNRDFIATIGNYRIEIEYESGDSRLLKLYLWDANSNVLDYNRVKSDDENYDTLMAYFSSIQRSAANVPSILSSIVAQLKMSE